jgi:hypothetical protein
VLKIIAEASAVEVIERFGEIPEEIWGKPQSSVSFSRLNGNSQSKG